MTQQPTDAFIARVRETYQVADPVFTELLKEQQELKIFFAMFRAALEVSIPDNNAQIVIDSINQLLRYFDKSTGIIAVHQGLAKMVNAVCSEQEE